MTTVSAVIQLSLLIINFPLACDYNIVLRVWRSISDVDSNCTNLALMVRTLRTDWAVLRVVCLSLLLSRCHGVFYTPYQHLPLASFKFFNGTFGFPSGETQIFDEGTPMTIRWSTDFVAVNLYVVYNASSIPPSAGLQKQLSSKH